MLGDRINFILRNKGGGTEGKVVEEATIKEIKTNGRENLSNDEEE